MAALRTLVVIILVGASVTGQESPQSPAKARSEHPVKATLRLEGGRNTFKVGEPIRFELVFTAVAPGYMAETGGIDDAAEPLTISPESAVRRLAPVRGRHTFSYHGDITQTTNVFPMCANYWALFDRPGTYTISLVTRRVTVNKWPPEQERIALTTNAVSFTIEPTTPEDEQRLIAAADQSLRAALTMGVREQTRAAEMLAFLPFDAAAIAKQRWHKELAGKALPSNAYHLLRRGFEMTRNPAAILAAIEADLANLDEPVMWDMISNATSIALAIKYPGLRYEELEPLSATGVHPFLIEQAKYVDLVTGSLEHRTGQSKLLSAAAILWGMADRTPRHVTQLVIGGFAQLPTDSRLHLTDIRWQVFRDLSLGPVLRRTLDEVQPHSRSSIFRALIDIAPELAIEPLTADILHPTRVVTADLVAKMPSGSMRHVAAPLLANIRKVLDTSNPDASRMNWKISVLAVLADGTFRNDLRELYDRFGTQLDSLTQSRLLHYLLRWAPDEGKRLLSAALSRSDDRSMLHSITNLEPLPALTSVLRHDLFDRDLDIASGAAYLLAKHAQADDIAAIEQRLTQWRIDAQRRLGLGEALTKPDDEFEESLVSALANFRPTTADERAQLSAACLTEVCRTALKRR